MEQFNDDNQFTFNKAPARDCDLVMKGGITSGVVYPPAVLKLQETFRFRCIGGTSAGAIAAAITAAAEFSRETGGFQRLDALRKQLMEPGFLLQLFKPTAETAPAFKTLTELFMTAAPQTAAPPSAMWRRIVAFAIRARRVLGSHFASAMATGNAVGLFLGAVPASLVLLGLLLASTPGQVLGLGDVVIPLVVVAIASMAIGAWVVGAVWAGAAFAKIFTHNLPEQGNFGLCVGYEGEDEKTALTTWLADQIDALAGKQPGQPPLTFADLAHKRDPGGAGVDVMLKMVTSNLSHRQPYVFPREGDIFLFREADMTRFFPARIVAYLKEAGSDGGLPLPPGYFFLPEGNKLPVIFATRLSLSFPILLSAVRLYTIKPAAFAEYRRQKRAKEPFTFDAERDFQANWFSDGGISSNFPIHFFDSWLPTRPTFGINLADVPAEGKTADGRIKSDQFSAMPEDAEGPAAVEPKEVVSMDDVFLPHPREAKAVPQWHPVAGMWGFIVSMFDTARNYRDAMQAMLPSYRERVVQVRLTSKEGGLNLAMAPETIRRIGDKGREAGEKLAGLDFRQHQWVRFRVLMAYLEKGILRMREVFPERGHYQALFDEQLAARNGGTRGTRWYKPEDEAWCQRAATRMDAIIELGSSWDQEFFGRDPPKPEAALRVTPPL